MMRKTLLALAALGWAGAALADDGIGLKVGGASVLLGSRLLPADTPARIAPDLGIGWAAASSTPEAWSVVAGVGLRLTQAPRKALAASCGSPVCADNASRAATLEHDPLRQPFEDVKARPVVSIGVSYRF